MGKLTIGFAVVLIALGAWGYVNTGSSHPTALIPSYFGLVLVVAGALANTEDVKRRALWMHIAVTVGLLGFLGTVKSLVDEARMMGGKVYEHPAAVQDKAIFSLLCLIFVLLCVRTFIAARRARLASLPA